MHLKMLVIVGLFVLLNQVDLIQSGQSCCEYYKSLPTIPMLMESYTIKLQSLDMQTSCQEHISFNNENILSFGSILELSKLLFLSILS